MAAQTAIKPLMVAMIAALTLAACQNQSASAPPPNSDTAPAADTRTPPPVLRAMGNEPFWSIEIDGNQLLYTTPENMPGQRIEANWINEGKGWRWIGNAGQSAFDLTIEPGQCDDTMVDRSYAYSARVLMAGKTLQGCADLPEKTRGE